MKRYGVQALVLFLSVFLYFTNLSALPFINQLYNFLRSLVQPLFELKGNITENTKNAINTYILLKEASIENQKLKKELQAYQLYKLQLYACEKELQNLSKAMNLPFEIKETSLVYANVIAYDPSGNDTFILINKGQDAGLWEGMVVFYEDKLVGIVDEVYGSSSRVRTVFSKDFSISATSRDKAYIYKGGYPYGLLLHVNLEDQLKMGDLVLLRSPSKNIPPLVIGMVSSISEEGKSFFKRVEVKPAIDIRRVSTCTLIKEKL
ncbi:MAG: rod shape-determining protein MreC [Aquificaceae bacterium]